MSKIYCKNCGTPTELLTAKFCANCGQPFYTTKATTTPVKQQTPSRPAPINVNYSDDDDEQPVDTSDLPEMKVRVEGLDSLRQNRSTIGSLIGTPKQESYRNENPGTKKKKSKKSVLADFQNEASNKPRSNPTIIG